MKPIPVSAGKRIADEFDYDQVVIVARKVGGGEHVTSYGIDKAHCDVAAKMGDFFKYKLMKWEPEGVSRTEPALTDALRDVKAERTRQVSVEGWTPEHDDHHTTGDLAKVAAFYAAAGLRLTGTVPDGWPWDEDWWKPKDNRSNLVRAGALILAEIERLDRALVAAKGQSE